METIVVLLMMSLAILFERSSDPSPGVFSSREDARNLDCTRLSQAEAHARYPAQVPDPPPRGTWAVSEALACTGRFMREGERPARDEAVLSSLRRSVGDIVQVATAVAPGDSTWHIDAFYPDAAVAGKISVAAKTDMAERGRTVSDRVPLLAAGDIAVLGRMPPSQAYALACTRYFAQDVLKEHDVFLALMIVDARETQLHAGLCVRGQWTWLR
jgi:hypothetical protein